MRPLCKPTRNLYSGSLAAWRGLPGDATLLRSGETVGEAGEVHIGEVGLARPLPTLVRGALGGFFPVPPGGGGGL